jgi:protein-disulfide isomerase
MDKRFAAILIGLVVILGGIFFFSQKNNSSSGGNAQPTNHVVGKGTNGVKLVEYGDYQCPVCKNYEPVVEQVLAHYGDKLSFQFSNLPLYPSPHPFALTAAKAAEAADKQGKFWQMHNTLYLPANWNVWTTSKNPGPEFDKYAQQLGLDMTKYHQDFASDEVNNAIQADISAFDKTGHEKSTPSFFINGTYVDNSELVDQTTGLPTLAKFAQKIDSAAKAKTQ